MRSVRATFYIYGTKTDISAPDDEDDWGKYSFEHPNNQIYGLFPFTDHKGKIELTIRVPNSFMITVWDQVDDVVIDAPDPQNYEHQNAIIEFYDRAFTLLNNFIQRYRTRTFDYKNEPIKWRAAKWLDPQKGTRRRVFELGTPLKEFNVEWEVDGEPSTAPANVNLKVEHSYNTRSHAVYSFEVNTLELICQDVEHLLHGEKVEGGVYETALELLMHAQEIVVREDRERKEGRPATICAALITVASACEIFVRDFIKQHGNPLHKFIIEEKETSFSVINLLDRVLPEIPAFGRPLREFNAELAHNLSNWQIVR